MKSPGRSASPGKSLGDSQRWSEQSARGESRLSSKPSREVSTLPLAHDFSPSLGCVFTRDRDGAVLQGTRQTTAPKEKLRAGSPPRQPKPTGKAAEKLLARKKMLVLCDLPKRGDPRPVRTPLTT